MAVNALAGLAREAASSPFMRGLTALPYRLAGAPVDLADMVVRPIANAAGIPIAEPENMYGTSDWMIKQAIDAGLLMPRTDTRSEMAGDFLGQIAAPGVGPGEAMMASSIGAIPMRAQNALADLSYMAGHRPMRVEQGAAPAYDLTGAFGEDIYGPNALQYFGSGLPGERETLRALRQIRGNPDAMVTIYRGVPEGVNAINPGDWVSLSPHYAAEYGNVVKMQVPARHLTGSPDAMVEFGYYPD